MEHRMKVCLAGTPAQRTRSPVLSGKRIRLHRKLLTLLFGPEESLTILIPGRTIKDIQIKEEKNYE